MKFALKTTGAAAQERAGAAAIKKSPPSNILPETGIVRLPTVLAVFPVGRTTWWQGIKEGRYPAPVALSKRAVGWRAEDIRNLIQTAA